MQAVIGAADGDAYQVELDDSQTQPLLGKAIGDEVDGGVLGLDGYTLEITGGSDTEGFPMRRTLSGTGRRRLLVDREGVGSDDGERIRKSFRGNTVSDDIAQLNLTVVEAGSQDIDALLNADDAAEGEGGDQ